MAGIPKSREVRRVKCVNTAMCVNTSSTFSSSHSSSAERVTRDDSVQAGAHHCRCDDISEKDVPALRTYSRTMTGNHDDMMAAGSPASKGI
ncbi:hypothetical protein RRG08_058643 [Elysia crispata]|uniref:Uncharacterized protein n=1 Tax=Elysia crispata TaxID=231223 RepID=A0AAE0Z136_9GAST|nr:hypothetical protein RRG08_058643 [Elysia crispata]